MHKGKPASKSKYDRQFSDVSNQSYWKALPYLNLNVIIMCECFAKVKIEMEEVRKKNEHEPYVWIIKNQALGFRSKEGQ